MSKNKSISLGNHFKELVCTRIGKRLLTIANEVIRVGLRLFDEEQKFYDLRKATQDGIDSGMAEDFDLKTHLNELK